MRNEHDCKEDIRKKTEETKKSGSIDMKQNAKTRFIRHTEDICSRKRFALTKRTTTKTDTRKRRLL